MCQIAGIGIGGMAAQMRRSILRGVDRVQLSLGAQFLESYSNRETLRGQHVGLVFWGVWAVVVLYRGI